MQIYELLMVMIDKFETDLNEWIPLCRPRNNTKEETNKNQIKPINRKSSRIKAENLQKLMHTIQSIQSATVGR